MEKDQYLLRKQRIKGAKKLDHEELEALYRQEPNRKIPLLPFSPYIWFYQIGKNNYEPEKVSEKIAQIREKYEDKIANHPEKPKKQEKLRRKMRRKIEKKEKVLDEGNLLMRWGEPLAIYDSTLSRNAASQMELYVNTKGYFNAEVDYRVKTSGKKARVIYEIDEGNPHRIDSVLYTTNDSTIRNFIIANLKDSHLEKGQIYDQQHLTQERERIEELLQNYGYFDFSRQYLNYKVYDTLPENKLIIEMTVSNPAGKRNHQLFKIDSVIFITDAGLYGGQSKRTSSTYKGINYQYFEDKYSKKILDRRLFIYPDSLYSKQNTFDTQRQLANLDIFKFININYDSSGGKFIANIYTSPLKKFQTSNEVGINVTQGLPGPFYNVSFKNRNLFGGLEILELNGRIGVEGVASASDATEVYRSTEAGGNLSLTFPQFLLPLGDKLKNRLGDMNPKTRVLAGTSFTNRPEYLRTTFNSSVMYSWVTKRNTLFNFTLSDLNLIYSDNLSPEFSKRLDEFEEAGNNLKNSFEPSFVNSMIFQAIFNSNEYGFSSEKASFLKLYLENGGTSLFSTKFLENQGLEFYRFIKFFVDYRKYVPLPEDNTFAFRINFGVAKPYGENKILPYEKYFFAGGSNGIRAWRPRRLGPGSYTALDSLGNIDDRFEQQAEMIIETSFEIRRKLIGFLDGAVFLDAGNVWTLQEDQLRPGAEFDPETFYREIAVGSGIGLRLNFSFLIVRLDAGLKIYDPARPVGNRFILSHGFNDSPYDQTENMILNLGIGYPF